MLDKDIKKDVPYFDQWDSDEFKKLIEFMKENNYIIKPGKYTFNQAWGFEDGLFCIKRLDKNGKISIEKREILKFRKK